MKEGYIPKDQRKTILLLSDDLRMPSGVGVMSREIVMGTAHRFNWVQLGAAVQHPEAGKIMDASESMSADLGFDVSLRIYPYNGYGDANILRHLMQHEKPDAILHFTDPRYWVWLYQMEHEIRQHTPILFYHVWDDMPFPRYNEDYYRSCDWISCISRQTYNIVRNVWKKGPQPEQWQVKYIPHGVDHNLFKPLRDDEKVVEMRKRMFGDDQPEFVVMYNNRNIRRKQTSDVLLAFQQFVHGLPEEKRNKVALLMHTQPVDDNGTDLPAVIRDVTPDIRVIFSTERVDTATMNLLYNCADVVINLASNEGFGLGTLEAIVSGRMIIANVTGGLQDQMGFLDENAVALHEDVHYTSTWGTNADGKYTDHGSWVVPVFPNNRSLIGSPPTPYIFDDRCTYQDAAKAIRTVYDLSPEERVSRGEIGRTWAILSNMSAEGMAQQFVEGIEEALANWKPRKRFELVTP